MARRCALSGKGVQTGNRVSHSKRRTRHRFLPNLQSQRFWSPALGKFVTLKVAVSTIRTIDKVGIDQYAKKMGIKLA